MSDTTNSGAPRGAVTAENPLSTAQLRYERRAAAIAAGPGPAQTRPFGLRAAVAVPAPLRPDIRFCDTAQVAVDTEGRPLIATMGKQWKTKANSDGDEGPEEDYGWEED